MTLSPTTRNALERLLTRKPELLALNPAEGLARLLEAARQAGIAISAEEQAALPEWLQTLSANTLDDRALETVSGCGSIKPPSFLS